MPNDSSFGELPTFGMQPVSTTGNTSYSVPQSNAGDVWAGAWDRLGAQVGEWADAAAKDAAKTAGAIAGLDPNYRPSSWDWTSRGQVFRAAAQVSYENQLEAKVRDGYGQVYHDWSQLDASQRDPAALAKSLQDVHDGLLKNDIFPQVQPAFEKASSTLISAYNKAGVADFDKRTLDDATAAGIQNRNSVQETGLRLASIPNADPALVDAQIAAHDKLVDQAVDAGEISSKVAGDRVKDLYRQQVQLARAKTAFNALPDADKASALAKFNVDYGQGPQPSGAKPTAAAIGAAILGQESGNNPNAPPSIDGARGPGQITPGTFARFAQPGERIDSADDNRRVSQRIVSSYYGKYGGDAQRVAVAYFSGEGNVAPPGSPTPWKEDRADGNGKSVSSYVGDVTRRLGQPNFSTGLTNDSFNTLRGEMTAEVKRVQVQADHAQRTAVQEIDTAKKQIVAGDDLSPAAFAQLQSKFATSPDPVVQNSFATLAGVRGTLAALKGQSPAQVDEAVRGLDATIAAGGASAVQAEMQAAAHAFQARFRKDVASDPTGRFSRDHALAMPAIDSSTPGALTASVMARQPVADAAAAEYGQPARLFTPDERAQFKSIAAEGGPRMVQTAGALAAALGPRLDGALKEIGGDAPAFATLARLQAQGGDPGFMNDLGAFHRLQSDPATRKAMELPKRDAVNAVLKDTFGGALTAIPDMNTAVRAAAANAFQVRAFREGYDKSLSDSAAKAQLARTAQQAAGATYDGAVQYGGVGSGARASWWNGGDRLLVPPRLRADRLPDALAALTDEDVQMVGSPVSSDGKTPSARVLSGSVLQSAGAGRYYVYTADPASKDAQRYRNADGTPFLLDLNKLSDRLRSRMPAGSWK